MEATISKIIGVELMVEVALSEQFTAFAKFGDTKADGKTITLTQIDKWFKQAHIFVNKKITTTDTAINFNKLKSKNITAAQFYQFLENLAKEKNVGLDELKYKLTNCGPPETTNTTQAVKTGGVERLTDVSGYTGSHKERFDATGKGKGKKGREDIADDSGYVSGYKNKGTYDKTH